MDGLHVLDVAAEKLLGRWEEKPAVKFGAYHI